MSLNLLFRSSHALSSEAIEIFDASIYSHVDIVWPDGRLFGARSDVIGGVPAGVQFRPANYDPTSVTKLITVPCEPGKAAKGMSWALSQKGLPYDPLAIVAFGLGRNWRTENAWFCSELATRMLEVAFAYELPIIMSKITPGTCACVAGSLGRT